MRRLERREVNRRERNRMALLNDGFRQLRQCLPTFSYEGNLSRIDTLRLAILYLKFLHESLHETTVNGEELVAVSDP